MGFLDGIKEFYFNIEEKYYNFLDAVDEKIPVYGIIDPIDKVVPSFALFIILGIILLMLLFTAVFGAAAGGGAFTVAVQGTNGSPIEGASVSFIKGGTELAEVETDELGIAKQYGLALDDEIEVVVKKSNYTTFRNTYYVFELPQAEEVIFQKESESYGVKTIRLLDELGQPAAGTFTLKFRCSNTYAVAPSSITLSASNRGVAIVEVPNNCERLTVDVSDTTNFVEVSGETIVSDDQAIYLSGLDMDAGIIVANVRGSSGTGVDGVRVEVYKYSELLQNQNVGPIMVDYTYSGQAEFSLSPGDYILKTYDDSGNYSEQTSSRITLGSGETATVTMTLSEDIKGQIMIEVLDKSNGQPIEDARVRLFYSDSDEELVSQETDSEGKAEFNISRDIEYKAVVVADNYQIGRKIVSISDNYHTIELSKCTSTTCGALRVKVVDQDGEPVRNATVALYNASTNFVSGYLPKTSDINGIAKFYGVSSGNYYGFAYKENFAGRSDAGYFDSSLEESDEPNLVIAMDTGEGTVRVVVKDDDGEAIPFASVAIFDARTDESIGSDFTDAEGVKEFTLKADKFVYLVVGKPDEESYAKYVTAKKQVLPSTVQEFKVTLEKTILEDTISIQYLGIYKGNERAQNAKAGDKYIAKFKVRVPEESEYEEMGVHIRVGEDVLMEKDQLFIGAVNAPRSSQFRATKYEEFSSLEADDYDPTVGDAKWVNLLWEDSSEIMPGVYEVEAEIEIKESVSIGEKMFLYYRAWGDGDGVERFPDDDSVSIELYSNTKYEIIQVGIVTLCDEDFCFTATVTDIEEDLIDSVTDSYTARIFNQYHMQFIITNNSETKIHDNANLRIKNEDESLKFFDFTLTNAESAETEGVVNGYEFERLDTGDLLPKQSIRMEADFTPQKAVNGMLNISLVSDQTIVFDKTLTFIIGAPKELALEIDPSVYLSGVENDIEVLVTDASSKLEVDEAIVRLLDKHGNILDYDVSKKDGITKLTLPAQPPGEKLTIEAEKINYNVKSVEVTVSEDLLEINPSTIGVSLNTKNKLKAEDAISIRNIAPYTLKIKEISLQGNFKNVIDKQQVRNWLESSYPGMKIEADEKAEIILKTFLSEEARQLGERMDFEGELVIIAENFGQEWLFKVPVKIAVGLGDEVDDPACLVVTRKEWVTTSSGTPKRIEFQIQNNCTVGGNPVSLQDLEAKVTWNSNQLGEYALNFGADEVILRPGYFRLMLGTIEAEQALTSILTFTPYGGVNGKAQADIEIQATNPLDGENQVLSNSISTSISVVNIEQCISYDKTLLVLEKGETGSFTVTASDICGEPVEFEIETDLTAAPSDGFVLQPGESQTIEVYADVEYPGQYPLYLLPKFSTEKKEQLVKNLRVIVNHAGCWQLSKYEFDVYDDPEYDFDGFDVANLSNTCVEKPVQVTVNAKDFEDALQDGLGWGLASMAAVLLSNWGNKDVGLLGNPKEDKTAEEIAKEQAKVKEKLDDPNISEADKQKLQAELTALKTTEANRSKLGNSYTITTKNGTEYAYNNLNSSDCFKWNETDWVQVNSATCGSLFGSTTTSGAPSTGITPISGTTDLGKLIIPMINREGWGYDNEKSLYKQTSGGWTLVARAPSPNGTLKEEGTNVYWDDTTARKKYPFDFIGETWGAPIAYTAGNPSDILPELPTIQALVTASNAGLAGGLLGGAQNLITGILGTNPLVGGILGTVGGTAASYMQQDEEITFTVIQRDADIQAVELVRGTKDSEERDDDIGIDVQGLSGAGVSVLGELGIDGVSSGSTTEVPQPIVNNPDSISQRLEVFRTIFTNETGFTTEEARPKYSQLKVTGIRHKYSDKTYSREDFVDEEGGFLGFFDEDVLDKTKSKLDEDAPDMLEQRYNLEFNSVPPQVETVEPIGILNCQNGTRVGATGYDALPKVKFAWNWTEIGADECDEDNENGIFCDGTQFSIALLKKINTLADYVANNGADFTCPSPREDEPAENEIDSYDIGVASLGAGRQGTEIEIIAEIQNTNPGIITTGVELKVIGLAGQGEVSCPEEIQEVTVAAGGTETVSCVFTDLEAGYYTAEAEIIPSVSCENCEDVVATNTLSRNFFAGDSGLRECEPYSTSRLDLFLQASGLSNEEMVSLTKFNATLMVDGYSTDFQKDFDVAQNEAFFSAPDFYINQETGLGVYFGDPELFAFDAYSQPDYHLPGPGVYSVSVDIEYGNDSWQLFDDDGNPNAKINIIMEKLNAADPDSPFYYIPLDGLIGVDSGRVGYGMNYEGDAVIIDNGSEPIRTVEIPGSAPIDNGTLSVTYSDSFKKMQVDEQGLIAKLTRAGDGVDLLMQPSNATPVILEITKETNGDAYAIYQVGIDGDAIDVGQTLALWNGVGASCRGFDDTVMSQQQFVPDTHGINARCALIGENQRSKYTLEFCDDPVNFGSVFYKTVFYTPQESDSYIELADVASDSAKFIGADTTGRQVSLNGNTITSDIQTLEDVFELVKDEYVCISGTNLNAEFFWNPKKVLDTMVSKEESAIDKCIAS